MRSMIKRNDIILLGIIIFIGIAAILILNITKSNGSKAVITIDGKVYKTLDLNKDTTLTIREDNGGYNTLQIKNGVVDMIDANCPDKICEKHKNIHYNGETIVCLPHKLVVEIKGGEDSKADMTAQ